MLGYKLRHETKKKKKMENRFGFMMIYHGIYLLRHLMKKKKYREAWKDLHMVFIDLKSIR